MVREKVFITKEREVNTYSELWHASSCTLEKGLNEQKGSSWQFLSSIILTAFTFEAYLNHAGSRVFVCWNNIEKLSPLAKFSLLCENLKVSFSKGKRPHCTITELFKFRNSIAHGKSEDKKDTYTQDNNDCLDSELGKRILVDWETKIQTSDFAKRVHEDVKIVLTKLHDALPEPKEHLFFSGISQNKAELK